MPDREKVINGLREMSCRATWKDIDRIRDKFQPIINDALTLLKEQEALEKRNEPIEPIKPEELWICGACCEGIVGWDDWIIGDTRHNYCPNCGQAVKWE